jgi:hypothetical protein
VLASGSRQVWELLESDTARGEKTNGRLRGAAVETDTPWPRRLWRCGSAWWRPTESPEVDGEAGAWWRAGIRALDDRDAMVAIVIARLRRWRGERRTRRSVHGLPVATRVEFVEVD